MWFGGNIIHVKDKTGGGMTSGKAEKEERTHSQKFMTDTKL